MTTTATKTKGRSIRENIAALRVEFKNIVEGLGYRNGVTPQDVIAQLREKVPAKRPTPTQWVAAAKEHTCPCVGCGGTGIFGEDKDCFRCAGKGFQTYEDGHRNRVFDKHRFRQPEGESASP